MKYMGSKARLAGSLYYAICKDLGGRNKRPWVEPFAGGMNMISAIPAEDGPRYAADVNEYLIAMFLAIQNGWVPPRSISREFYEECKKGLHEKHVIGYVGFNCSYSGKWFGGFAGVVETQGGIRDYQDEAWRHMEKQSSKLGDVFYCNASYDQIEIPENAIVYCDPPYLGTTGYRDDFDHAVFWNWVRNISETHSVYVSEYSAPADFESIWSLTVKSSLSANGKSGGNKESKENLFKVRKANVLE